ncbi:hypothetical protein ACHAWF_010605 [Thalassiosira exigua]
MSSISANDVTIKLRHEHDDRGEYGAFTSISVDIHVRGQKAGFVSGVIVNRQAIPERMFLSAMDGHSSDLQYIAVSLFEPRLGRTKLTSVRGGGDDKKYDVLYIEKMHVDDEYKRGGKSDVGAFALRQLLHHWYIKRRTDVWGVSSCVYILDPYEAMTQEVKQRIEDEELHASERQHAIMFRGAEAEPETEESLRAKEEKSRSMDNYARLDANQFLRNGFYQDAAVAVNDPRFLVAACEHWKRPLKSHAEAAAIQFYSPPPETRPPTGKNAEILELTKKMCRGCESSDAHPSTPPYQERRLNQERSSAYKADVSRLIRDGGSLAQSHALHAACALNDPTIVQSILQLDPSALETRDVNNVTPLMMAAHVAAGKSNKNGYPKDQPVIDALIVVGADRGAVLTRRG